jgi:hypothetical protein
VTFSFGGQQSWIPKLIVMASHFSPPTQLLMQTAPLVVGPAWLEPVLPLCCTAASAPLWFRHGTPGRISSRSTPGP